MDQYYIINRIGQCNHININKCERLAAKNNCRSPTESTSRSPWDTALNTALNINKYMCKV